MKIQLLKLVFLCFFLCQSLFSVAQVEVTKEVVCKNIVTLIINSKGQKLSSFSADSDVTIFGNQLYFTQGNKLNVLDLSLFE